MKQEAYYENKTTELGCKRDEINSVESRRGNLNKSLGRVESTIDKLTPVFREMDRLIQKQDEKKNNEIFRFHLFYQELKTAEHLVSKYSNLSSSSCDKMRKYERKLLECDSSLQEACKLSLDREALNTQRVSRRAPMAWSVDPKHLRCLLISQLIFVIYVMMVFLLFTNFFKINISLLLHMVFKHRKLFLCNCTCVWSVALKLIVIK